MKARMIGVMGIAALAALGTATLALTADGDGDAKTVENAAGERAEGLREIDWTDLTPPLSAKAQAAVVELNQRVDEMTDVEIATALAAIDEEGSVLVPEMDDTDVALSGYLVPLDFDAERVSEFVLVPYFGACIHVPPPPPNQIVYVKFREGLAMSVLEEGFYTPFRVKGRLRAAPAKTELADVGYQLTASGIEQDEDAQ